MVNALVQFIVGAAVIIATAKQVGPFKEMADWSVMLVQAAAGLPLVNGLAGLLAPVIPSIAPVLRFTNRLLHMAILLVADVALIVMVIIVTYAVTLRYVFDTGVGWAEEVPRLLVTLFAFIAMAMGVRDHSHIGVNIVYNLFKKDGRVRRFMVFFGDYIVLLCGLFMAYYGTTRCLQMSKLPGRLPMTGLNTWYTYLPIPLAGYVISYDSLLFLLGILKRDDLLYSEPEIDYVEEYEEQQTHKHEAEEASL